MDDAFLAEIEEWRSDLARNLARKNRRLKVRDLNFAVQRIIDRIIFLRMCEDRGIESYGQLQALLNGENVYARLKQLFYAADDKYNSGLFHFKPEPGRAEKPDELTDTLKIDNEVLKHIIGRLYYPESPYEFSVLSGDILGNVYEQFLGKVIHLTKTHQARIEEKPEVKKAGGVYYTPKYIVDYIVKNTVGKLCEGKTPKQIEKLKILDPACGSGSFLIGAYSHLLDYHRDWYVKNSIEGEPNPRPLPDAGRGERRLPKEIFQGSGGQWYLTTQKKKEILLNNIYGVDIDSQAVEVTKLNLLLKVLEGETKDTLESQMRFWHLRALPDLGNNIKCGNSLIGPDYYHGKQQTLFDEEEQIKVNAFDWKSEFPEIMKQGGFDAVIGNPPWGADFSMEEKQYLMNKFERVHMRTPDSFNYFLCNSHDLSGENGLIGFIVPNNFLFQHEYAKSREFFTKTAWLWQAINLGDGVFKVTAPSCMVVIRRTRPKLKGSDSLVADLRDIEREQLPLKLNHIDFNPVPLEDILASPDCIIPMNKYATSLTIKLINRWPTLLGDICDEIAAGIGTGGDKVFRISDAKAKSAKIEKDLLHPVLIGREINAYFLPEKTGYSIVYSTKNISKKTHPRALKYLKPFQSQLSKKRETRKGLIPWWSLHWPRYPELFTAPKIVLRQTANSLYATLDTIGYYCLNSIIIIRPKKESLSKYLIGLLNSRLLRWLYENITQEQNRVFAEVKPINLRKLPIRPINLSESSDKRGFEEITTSVDQMFKLHKQLTATKNPNDKTRLQRQIEAIDRQIDRLVYELYGLTEEEIAVVEGKAT